MTFSPTLTKRVTVCTSCLGVIINSTHLHSHSQLLDINLYINLYSHPHYQTGVPIPLSCLSCFCCFPSPRADSALQSPDKSKPVVISGALSQHLWVLAISSVFEIHNGIHNGLPRTRTSYIIAGVQCKMFKNYWEFQDGDSKMLNQVWNSSKYSSKGGAPVKPALGPPPPPHSPPYLGPHVDQFQDCIPALNTLLYVWSTYPQSFLTILNAGYCYHRTATIEWALAITNEQQSQTPTQMCLISEWVIITSAVLTLSPHGLADF